MLEGAMRALEAVLGFVKEKLTAGGEVEVPSKADEDGVALSLEARCPSSEALGRLGSGVLAESKSLNARFFSLFFTSDILSALEVTGFNSNDVPLKNRRYSLRLCCIAPEKVLVVPLFRK